MYLGQVLHGGGLDNSAEDTGQERMGRIKGATIEIRTIIEEFQKQECCWDNGTWFEPGDCKAAVDLCEKAQSFYWRVMLKVPKSCPKIALDSETGMMGMK